MRELRGSRVAKVRRGAASGAMVATLATFLGALGCGTLPLPQSAVEGTTITLPLPVNFPKGYGRVLAADPDQASVPSYSAGSAVEDPQRGELIFELVDAAGVSPRGAGNPQYLNLRYLTRLKPDPSAPGVIENHAVSPTYRGGQDVAILDLPDDPVDADTDLFIKITRYRRAAGTGGNAFSLLPQAQTGQGQDWFGWGSDYAGGGLSVGTSGDPTPIRILDSAGLPDPTPKVGWLNFVPYGLIVNPMEPNLDELVPLPQVSVRAEQAGPNGPPPAAWELELTYPRNIMKVRAVTPVSVSPGFAIVTWQADQSAADCLTGSDTLKIQVVDPNVTTRIVNVAFELINFDDTCGRRLDLADVPVVPGSFKGYDVNGVDSSATWIADVIPLSDAFQ